MVQEAEQFKAEDESQRDKITAKNSLESLAFNMKSTVDDEKLQDKISSEDKKTIVDKCNEIIAWLDKNQVKLSTMNLCTRSSSIAMTLQRSHLAISHFPFGFYMINIQAL